MLLRASGRSYRFENSRKERESFEIKGKTGPCTGTISLRDLRRVVSSHFTIDPISQKFHKIIAFLRTVSTCIFCFIVVFLWMLVHTVSDRINFITQILQLSSCGCFCVPQQVVIFPVSCGGWWRVRLTFSRSYYYLRGWAPVLKDFTFNAQQKKLKKTW